MNDIKGSCHCNNIRLNVSLSLPITSYAPRACDCDFCTKHGASYLSDREGVVSIEVDDKNFLGHYRQGSETADFILCQKCGVLIGVCYRMDHHLFMAVNSKVFGSTHFGETISASPKKFSKEEKVKRWMEIWFSDVKFDSIKI